MKKRHVTHLPQGSFLNISSKWDKQKTKKIILCLFIIIISNILMCQTFWVSWNFYMHIFHMFFNIFKKLFQANV